MSFSFGYDDNKKATTEGPYYEFKLKHCFCSLQVWDIISKGFMYILMHLTLHLLFHYHFFPLFLSFHWVVFLTNHLHFEIRANMS